MKPIIPILIILALFVGSNVLADSEVEESSEPVTSSYTETIIEEGVAETEISLTTFPGFDKRISIDLRQLEVADVLKFLAAEGDINFAIASDVTGTVNILLNDVRIQDIFEIILATNGLAYYVQGNVISVISNVSYKVREGVDFLDRRQTVAYQLKFASAQTLGTFLGNIKSEIGQITFDDSTGLLILVDTPQKIKEMKAIVDKAEMPTVARVLPTQTGAYELQYARVEDIEEQITAVLTPDIGTIRIDPRTNSVIVSDLPHIMEKIEILIAVFDRKTRAVFIEAKIVQVTLSDTHKWGIDWDRVFTKAGDKKGMTITPEVTMPLSLSTFGKLSVTRTGNSTLSSIMEVLTTIGDTKILSNPHITVADGTEAIINVAIEQPYSETTTTTTGSSTTTATEFTFVNVGVKLTVTPTINADDYLSIAIKPEISSITSFFPNATAADRAPVIETANAETTVLVKDGITILIAGMIKGTKTLSDNRVPVVGRVPVMGKAFSNKSDEIQNTETMVFLTPRIVSGDESFLLDRDLKKDTKEIW